MKRGSSAEKKADGVQEEHVKGESLNTEILIVGGGIAGLATALALHRIGLKSLVLERSESLRAGGTSIALWENAWCTLDALGVSSEFGKEYWSLDRLELLSKNGMLLKDLCLRSDDSKWRHQLRCVERQLLLETLAKPLPSDTILFNSRVVAIHKGRKASRTVVELGDGTFIGTKVLIGCDGVHSVVAKWMGLPEPTFAGGYALRGLVTYPEGHKQEPVFRQVIGEGVRAGLMPINATKLYWFIVHNLRAPENTWDSEVIRQEALELLRGFPQELVTDVIKATQAETLASSTLRMRWVWPVIMGPRQLTKGGATVAGDAMHAMRPDIGQGGCSALEDAVVLARSIAGAMKIKTKKAAAADEEEEEMRLIEKGLRDYVQERQGRVFGVSLGAYIIGWILSWRSWPMKWVRDAILLPCMTASSMLSHTQYQCGPLVLSHDRF